MVLQGKGFYIWRIKDCERGNAIDISSVAQAAGLSHVLIKVADGAYTYNYDRNQRLDLVPPVANALRSMGIQVWGWQYVYGDYPSNEASIAVQRVNDLHLDGFVVDVEDQYEDPSKKTAAKTYMRELRSGIGNNIPIALSSYRFPSLHPIPWNEFLEKCDINMPQVYWMGAHNPGSQLTRTLHEFENMTYQRPIIPTGAAYMERGWAPTLQDIQEFLISAKSANLTAANFWEWRNCREVLMPNHQIWNVIANFEWSGGSNPPQDITGQLIEALNSRNTNVLADLYADRAVHVTSDRTIIGRDKILSWYHTFFNQHLPNGIFFLSGYSGTGNSRHLTWTAQSTAGKVNDGNDTLGLINDKITYHYTYFTVS